ncbi:MAG: hypothetical protein GY801_40435 [bacterium]|nr:hypothetical protein [bacterium]
MRRIFKSKKILFGIIYFIIIYALTECFSWSFYLIKEKSFFSFTDHQQYRLAIIQNTPTLAPPNGVIPVPSINSEVIHPYLGFVVNPQEAKGYSAYGFRGDIPTFHHNNDDVIILGIFGGSFAADTAQYGVDEILAQIRQLPELEHKKIIVQPIALGGYKQPQQLLALTYFLSLGAHFDIIINLDGFNEVALAPAENAGLIYPFYPRGWAARTSNFVDPIKLKLIGTMTILDNQITWWAHVFAAPLLRHNITANLIWHYRHSHLHNRRMNLSQRLEQDATKKAQEFGYMITGPTFHYETEEIMFQELATVWKRASLQMHHLCQANTIEYFHFLQPNQYVPGTKVLNSRELEIAFQEDHPYRRGVVHGYPFLAQAGKKLQEDGVNFYDLTKVFINDKNPLYSDTYCHLTTEGYQIIGSAIGKVIRNYLNEHRNILNTGKKF